MEQIAKRSGPPPARAFADSEAGVEIAASLSSRLTAKPARPVTTLRSALQASGPARTKLASPAAPKSGGKPLVPESMQLSYEQALRRHARHQPQPEAAPQPPAESKAPTLPEASRRKAGSAPEPGSRARAATPPAGVAAVSRSSVSEAASVSPRQAQRVTPAEEPAVIKVRKRKAGATPAASAARVSGKTIPPLKRQSAMPPAAARVAAQRPAEIHAPPRSPSPKPEMALSARNLQIDLRDPDQLRREIVSVRLNEKELERLRLRASESGVSVSVYVRSCLLEAEHLRAQVKQVLAEMRAGGVSAQPAQLAVTANGQVSSTNLGGLGKAWSWFLTKSTTFLLGPWFPVRPRA